MKAYPWKRGDLVLAGDGPVVQVFRDTRVGRILNTRATWSITAGAPFNRRLTTGEELRVRLLGLDGVQAGAYLRGEPDAGQ